MSSRSSDAKSRAAARENGFLEEGGVAAVFRGTSETSNYVALTGSGDGGYDDEFYGPSSEYARTEVAPEDELDQPLNFESRVSRPVPQQPGGVAGVVRDGWGGWCGQSWVAGVKDVQGYWCNQ